MPDYKNMSELIKSLPNDKLILVAGHERTDYDSIGSSLAMTVFLNKIGKNAKLIMEQEDISKTKWLNVPDIIITEPPVENYNFIFVDADRTKRLGSIAKYFEKADIKLNIDHHEGNELDIPESHKLLESEISSTSEMLYKLFQYFDIELDKNIAKYLITGIISDTYAFFQRTTSETFKIVSELTKYTEEYELIYKKAFLEKSEVEIGALRKMISNIKYDGFHYIIMNKSHPSYQDVDYNGIYKKLSLIIRSMETIEILGLFLITEEKTFGEFRSNCEMDVDEIARILGGGGHKKASGFKNDMPIEEIISTVKEYIKANR